MSAQPPTDLDPLARHSLSATEIKELLALERRGEAFLAFRDEQHRLRFFSPDRADAASDATTTVGRRPEMDLALTGDQEVSGLHAELHHLGGEWTILDDGLSRNGTFVNGQRIQGRQRLRDEDRIRVGRTLLVYRAAQETLVQETAFAAEQPVPRLTDAQRRVLIALCRPCRDGSLATLATNQEIAAEVFLSVDTVKTHLRALFAKFELGELPQNQKRAMLAERALRSGAILHRDLD